MPPEADPAKYMTRLTTLEQFAAAAADEYFDDPMRATARYAVVRKQTGTLFANLNSALHTNFALPAPR